MLVPQVRPCRATSKKESACRPFLLPQRRAVGGTGRLFPRGSSSRSLPCPDPGGARQRGPPFRAPLSPAVRCEQNPSRPCLPSTRHRPCGVRSRRPPGGGAVALETGRPRDRPTLGVWLPAGTEPRAHGGRTGLWGGSGRSAGGRADLPTPPRRRRSRGQGDRARGPGRGSLSPSCSPPTIPLPPGLWAARLQGAGGPALPLSASALRGLCPRPALGHLPGGSFGHPASGLVAARDGGQVRPPVWGEMAEGPGHTLSQRQLMGREGSGRVPEHPALGRGLQAWGREGGSSLGSTSVWWLRVSEACSEVAPWRGRGDNTTSVPASW